MHRETLSVIISRAVPLPASECQPLGGGQLLSSHVWGALQCQARAPWANEEECILPKENYLLAKWRNLKAHTEQERAAKDDRQPLEIKNINSPGWVAQMVGAWSRTSKGCRFHLQSGHAWEEALSLFLSPLDLFSLSSLLSKIQWTYPRVRIKK